MLIQVCLHLGPDARKDIVAHLSPGDFVPEAPRHRVGDVGLRPRAPHRERNRERALLCEPDSSLSPRKCSTFSPCMGQKRSAVGSAE